MNFDNITAKKVTAVKSQGLDLRIRGWHTALADKAIWHCRCVQLCALLSDALSPTYPPQGRGLLASTL